MLKNDSRSIQQLLVAEKKAEEKTNQARKRKLLRLKQAKEDARSEVETLRQERDKEFKEHEAKFLGDKESSLLKIERDTEISLKDLNKYVELNKDFINNYLLEQVFTINCQVHENFRDAVM